MDSPSPASTYYSTVDTPSSSGTADSPPAGDAVVVQGGALDDSAALVNQLESMSLRASSQSPPPQQPPGAFPTELHLGPTHAPATASSTVGEDVAAVKVESAGVPPSLQPAAEAPIRATAAVARPEHSSPSKTSDVLSINSNASTLSSPGSNTMMPSPFPKIATDPHLTRPIVSPAPPSRRTVVIFQEACAGHRFIRSSDVTGIVERPERIRAVKTGVAAAWARLEARNVAQGGVRWMGNPPATPDSDDVAQNLGDLLNNMNIQDLKGKGKEILGGPFDVLQSTSRAAIDDPAIRLIHPLPHTAPGAPDVDIAPPPPTSPPAASTPTRASRASVASTPTRSGKEEATPASTSTPTAAERGPATLPPWPQQLANLCRGASTAIATGARHSEIPAHLPQGDLYLSEQSEDAIFGAIGAVCEGVDRVVQGSRTTGNGYDRAFVAIRPPGHHCCEATPMGFCFLNNVAVAAAHAHLNHGIERVVILDIDLHHGNGTQDIAWRINADANRAVQELQAKSPRKGSPRKGASPPCRPGLQIMYASLHDIFSYPCEDGDPSMVQAASLNLAGGHSQWISNVHIEPFGTEAEFHEKLYPKYRQGLLGAATKFLEQTASRDGEDENRTLIIISAGMDASEHESAGMSRHRRNVPTTFFHRFARETVGLATTHAAGKVLVVLEGGYSDRALCSATMALMVGLTESPRLLEKTFLAQDGNEISWWEEKNLAKIEKACKPKRGKLHTPFAAGTAAFAANASGASTNGATATAATVDHPDAWLNRAVEIFAAIEGSETVAAPNSDAVAAVKDKAGLGSRTMQLRERRPRGLGQDLGFGGGSRDSSPQPSAQSTPDKRSGVGATQPFVTASTSRGNNLISGEKAFTGLVRTQDISSLKGRSQGNLEASHDSNADSQFVMRHCHTSERTAPASDRSADDSAIALSAVTPEHHENAHPTVAPRIKFTWKQGGVE
ncbi:BZ3500_MvSof-1268-A1-R1_Chr1-3g01790 [Microbotryum saponariae]|uniref:BZ3500_MvSof-1268-A1-R1_Chr1-3g01790 protein n=1 Tax=Microbotryum saponariae TaxID=289078 RepID=A0A2X0KLG9_9BASI|nr:BZ3500_MvSof-1268-A1-R1_Chr1-3g01790 [Microbotryum saponariae]SCZ94572.1 BZ3501_MvSof-1269-A2-R1_Chr1-3g01392 [Microbotryum saponariae]